MTVNDIYLSFTAGVSQVVFILRRSLSAPKVVRDQGYLEYTYRDPISFRALLYKNAGKLYIKGAYYILW